MRILEIKNQLDIGKVLSHYSLTPNRNNLLCCPFHDDKTPSLQIFPKTNSFTCFSTKCQAGSGDQIQLLELLQGKGKAEAIKLAKELLGYREESLLEVFTKLRMNLQRSAKARVYAQGRGLKIEQMEVGYNGGSYKDLKHCLVFPLKDKSGQIVSLYGRSIYGNAANRHFYQKGRRGFYPEYPKSNTKKLILTEGVIDAVSLVQGGELRSEESVMALYGAKVLAADQEAAIKGLKELEEIVLFFDGDEAGSAAAEKWNVYLQSLINKS